MCYKSISVITNNTSDKRKNVNAHNKKKKKHEKDDAVNKWLGRIQRIFLNDTRP